MRKLIFIAGVLIFVRCTNQNETKDSSLEQSGGLKDIFKTCFAHIDTLKIGQSIGCSNGAYKLINNKYVIRILPNFPIQFDSCYAITIDSSNGKLLTELLVFDNKDANLTNICTDLINTTASKPSRQLYAQSGQLIIGSSDPTELNGTKTSRTTIFIKRLLFIDSKTGEKIELANELLWKVLNTGTPG
jgi:hypothetical protein